MKTPFPSIEPLESRIAPATLVVTNLADHGPGTLRAALDTANATPTTVDTIIFKLPAAPAHSENTIDLTTGTLGTFGNFKIIGPGAGKLIIDAQGNSQIFSISDNGIIGRGAAVDSPASISGLSIVGGHVAGGGGGAIYCTESLTLKNVVVSGNSTGGTSLTDLGGGLCVAGTASSTKVSISNCIFSNDSSGGIGGAIFLDGTKSVSIVNSVISNNSAASAAGGALISSPDVPSVIIVKGCTIAGNTVASTGISTAGLAIAGGGTTTVSATRITGNSGAPAGGGLDIGGHEGKTLITGSLISGNTAGYTGAGIDVDASGVAIPGDTLPSLTITKSIISGNKTTTSNSTMPGGAGIYIKGANSATTPANYLPTTISSTVISSNVSAANGGGIMIKYGVTATLSTCTISGNSTLGAANTDFGGGGVASFGKSSESVFLTVKGGAISGNSATGSARFGGGIAATGVGTLSVTSTLLTGNVATDGGGIAGYAVSPSSASPVTLKNVTATDNVALNFGGAFASALLGGSFSITGGSMKGNIAKDGGAIGVLTGGGSITGAIISGNIATAKGGGLYASGLVTAADLTVQIAKVTGNTAPTGPDVSGPMTYI
jgi:hypothetical protein